MFSRTVTSLNRDRDHALGQASPLAAFVSADNFGRRLKTLRGLTLDEGICKAWAAEPGRFRSSPLHHMPGQNI
ncbi:hypothetical protein ASG40_09820 [Methylobacterium sp. Leaf399]|nr:hypothetical protein ASG40_09820 [Methylobacterium sp. Leaf399]